MKWKGVGGQEMESFKPDFPLSWKWKLILIPFIGAAALFIIYMAGLLNFSIWYFIIYILS